MSEPVRGSRSVSFHRPLHSTYDISATTLQLPVLLLPLLLRLLLPLPLPLLPLLPLPLRLLLLAVTCDNCSDLFGWPLTTNHEDLMEV